LTEKFQRGRGYLPVGEEAGRGFQIRINWLKLLGIPNFSEDAG